MKFDLDERMLRFAVSVGRLVNQLPTDRLGSHVAGQLVRCGTAPVAHYAEARGAESRRDFIHKLRLALKELRESLAWLQLASRAGLIAATESDESIRECDELIAILVTSVATATRNLGARHPPRREHQREIGTGTG
jgi:four helix bundle protein